MGSIARSSEKPAVAVIGAGLAGLSAAYYLRKKTHVTVFEREARIGGRILTSRQLPGEHGAQFFLSRKNEPTIHKLIKELGLKPIPWKKWPGYIFRGRFAYGKPSSAAQDLLSLESAKRVRRLVKLVKKEAWRNPQGKFDQWLSDFLEKDREAIAFVEMLLAGETCAPINHVTALYGLECLSSMYDNWYSVREESSTLVEALARRSAAHILLRAEVIEVKEAGGEVHVRWKENYEEKSQIFQAAIIATPDGERLIGRPLHGHFHSYVNVLLGYERLPRLKIEPAFDLNRGLYTDGTLNYIQLTRQHDSYVLRLLIPNNVTMLRLKNQDLVDYCAEYLGQFITNARQFRKHSVNKWKFGLPCGGDAKDSGFRRVSQKVFLAGDRFGRWSSMDAAVFSGLAVANVLACKFSRQPRRHWNIDATGLDKKE